MNIKLSGRRVLLLGLALFTVGPVVGRADESTASLPSMAADMDWPFWRGPEMNGISRETGLVDSWSPKGENVLWSSDALAGRSTPIIMNGRLYTITRDQPGTKFEGEKVVCADAATGDVLWENRFGVFLSDVPDTRVGWSSVVGDPVTGNVFAMGVCDYFQCINGETGETLWSRSLSEQLGALNTYGGRTNFPVIHGNLVIISSIVIGWGEMAKPAHRFIAFDKRNGQSVWYTGTRPLPFDTTYSSPTTAVVNGQSMLIFASGDGGIHALQPQTGKNIWTFNMARRGIDSSPLVVGETVYAGQGEENLNDNTMGALTAIDATGTGNISKTGARWFHKKRTIGKSSPIMVDGKLITIENTARLNVVDPETGDVLSDKKLGTVMRGSPLYADGKIYCCTANGRWYIFRLNGDKLETVHKLRMRGAEVYASPIVSHGRIYLQTTEALYCIGSKDAEPAATPRPTPPEPTPVESDLTPAHVQVVPVESLLKPGQKQQFEVRLYNSRGQYLNTAAADQLQFSVDGPGEIDASGKYSTPEATGQQAAIIVTAKAGDLSGQARIRLVPDLPLEFDFDDGQVPISWVGARYRHIPLDFDLYESLKNDDELAGHLYIYLSSSFTNSGRPKLAFDDSTARKQWTSLLVYVGLRGDPAVVNELSGAQAAFDPALELLKSKGVLANWDWSQWDVDGQTGIKLAIERGAQRVSGNGVIVKIRTIPKGASSRSWMGHDTQHDYTIQADVMGNEVNRQIPDIGLIGQRYVLDLMGASQQLQIRTWSAQLRMAQSVPFEWQPRTWYTMKLQTAVEDGKAVLRGKAWPRTEPEPDGWLVEAVDENPNVTGSPGMFGNARSAEIFIDNVKITDNPAR